MSALRKLKNVLKSKPPALCAWLAGDITDEVTTGQVLRSAGVSEEKIRTRKGKTRAEAIALLKSLGGDETFGEFIVGRHKKDSRLKLNDPVEFRKLAASIVAGGRIPEPKTPDTRPPAVRIHRYWLRPDFELSFELPVDVSQAEVKRLSAYLATLPY